MANNNWIGGTSSAFGTAANWSTAGVPATGDTVITDFSATTNGIAGSDQSAITLAALYVRSTTPNSVYVGSQATSLKIGATIWRIGDAALGPIPGVFSGRVNLDFGTAAFTGVVVGTSNGTTDAGQESVRLKGVNASNLLIIQSGLVGVATNASGDVATLSEIDVLGGTVNIGSGVTLTTLKQTAGTTNLNCAVTTCRQIGGTLFTTGSGAITSAYAGGRSVYSSTGTTTTLEVPSGGTADFMQDFQAKTVTTIKLYKGATLNIGSHVTITNPIQLVECTLEDVTINVRPNVSLVLAYL